jgi:hypothetical protein
MIVTHDIEHHNLQLAQRLVLSAQVKSHFKTRRQRRAQRQHTHDCYSSTATQRSCVRLAMADLQQPQHTSDSQEPPSVDGSAIIDAMCAVIDVLPYLGPVLGLQGLACLASTCPQLKQECFAYIYGNVTALLLDALPSVNAEEGLAAVAERAAAAPPPPAAEAEACQRLQPVIWLLQVSPSTLSSAVAGADVLQRLVHLPHVPLPQAKQLVAAGVRIPYAQLLSAASSMVAGVEVWVQAQQQLGISTDVPAAAIAICCGEDSVSVQAGALSK